MENLRWILLIAGVALIALVYWNSRRRNAMDREQPPVGDGERPDSIGHSPRREPSLSADDLDDLDDPLFAPTPSWRFDEPDPPSRGDAATTTAPTAGSPEASPAPPLRPAEPPLGRPAEPPRSAPIAWETEPLVHDATPEAAAERADAAVCDDEPSADRDKQPLDDVPDFGIPEAAAPPHFDWAPLDAAAAPPQRSPEPEPEPAPAAAAHSADAPADAPADDGIPPPIEYDPAGLQSQAPSATGQSARDDGAAKTFARSPPASAQPTEEHFDAEPQTIGSVEEKLVVLHVVAAEGRDFPGPALRQLFAERGYQHGEMQIFHSRYEGKTVFSIVNLVEPGYFEPQRMDQTFHTPGVTLFMRLPGPLPADVAFDVLISEAQQMARELGGEARDAEHATLTRQRIQHLREEVQDYILRNRLGASH